MSSDANVTTLLETGIAAAKAGQRDEARHLLLQVVEQDETNVLGWLWLCGLMDDIDERQICLENVLALEPDNETARRGLARLRQQQRTVSPAPPPQPSAPHGNSSAPAPQKGAATYARASSTHRPRYKRLDPVTVAAATPLSQVAQPEPLADPLENEYGCPYCLAPTQPNDSVCPRCYKSLWLRVPRRPKPSTLFTILFWLQILNTVQYFVGVVLLIVSMTGLMMNAAAISQMEGMAGVDVTTAMVLPFILFMTIPIGLYNVALVFGLYKRWRPVYYLYLLNSVLTLGIAAALLFLMGWGALVCGAPLALFGMAQFFLILNLGEDFTFDKYRILLRADRDLKTGQDFMNRAHRYGDRKMWGMAALHFRRAGYLLASNLDCRLGLVVALINIKQYDLAAKSLAEAKLINAADPRIEKLEALLARSRPG